MFTWIAPEGDYTLDSVRSEETHVSHVGQEEYPAGQVVDTEFKKNCYRIYVSSRQTSNDNTGADTIESGLE